MESVQCLQQIPCNISHHTLVMLLHYLEKLKMFTFAANIEQTANDMHRCLHVHILMDLVYLFITFFAYYFNLWFLLHILFKQHTVLCKQVEMLTAKLHIEHVTLQFLEQAILFISDQMWGHQTVQTSI